MTVGPYNQSDYDSCINITYFEESHFWSLVSKLFLNIITLFGDISPTLKTFMSPPGPLGLMKSAFSMYLYDTNSLPLYCDYFKFKNFWNFGQKQSLPASWLWGLGRKPVFTLKYICTNKFFPNTYPDSHHLQGVWNLPHKFHLYLIYCFRFNIKRIARRG